MTSCVQSIRALLRCLIFSFAVLAWQPVLAQAEDESFPEYTVAVGDSLRVDVFRHPDLSGDCEIDDAGRCSLPLIKYVIAAGMTLSEIEAKITDKLKPDYLKDPQVRVEITGYRPVYVLGEVKTPGSYPYSAGMTVINAVALAGGYTYRAARKKISVVRASSADESGDKVRIKEHEILKPGDVIEIPERFF